MQRTPSIQAADLRRSAALAGLLAFEEEDEGAGGDDAVLGLGLEAVATAGVWIVNDSMLASGMNISGEATAGKGGGGGWFAGIEGGRLTRRVSAAVIDGDDDDDDDDDRMEGIFGGRLGGSLGGIASLAEDDDLLESLHGLS